MINLKTEKPRMLLPSLHSARALMSVSVSMSVSMSVSASVSASASVSVSVSVSAGRSQAKEKRTRENRGPQNEQPLSGRGRNHAQPQIPLRGREPKPRNRRGETGPGAQIETSKHTLLHPHRRCPVLKRP